MLLRSSKATRALQEAASKGDIAGIRAALAAGAKINGRTQQESFPALHLAIKEGHLLAAEYLISCGADPNLEAGGGKDWLHNPVHLAQQHEGVEALSLLLEAGADPDRGGSMWHGPIHAAAFDGRADQVEALLRAGADPNRRAARQQDTPLITACRENADACADVLLRHGADPRLANRNGHVPMDFGCWQVLMRHRVPLLNETQLDKMIRESLLDMEFLGAALRYAEEWRVVPSPNVSHWWLAKAAEQGLAEAAQVLLRRGFHPDETGESGPVTPLYRASVFALPQDDAEHRHEETVKLLLAAGADPLAILAEPWDGPPTTLLDAAQEQAPPHIAALLREAAAKRPAPEKAKGDW